MNLSTAIHLITKGFDPSDKPQTWADLGCGTGLFTQALASVLSTGSKLYAIDKEPASLEKVDIKTDGVTLTKVHQDFVHDLPGWGSCDGILMANSLHFVSDKLTFMRRIKGTLKPKGKIIVVEYEMENPNAWVPYPIPLLELNELMSNVGFSAVTKLAEEPSVFNPAKLYSALIA
ncbi:MAG TPA: class I SAM-dependent methyltransferase [Cyclobacteriaceae bacterium]